MNQEKVFLVECHPIMEVAAGKIIEIEPKIGDKVIVKFKDCEDMGEVKGYTDEKKVGVIIRRATEDDIKKKEENKKWEEYAFKEFKSMVKKHNFPMKVIDIHSWIDRKKVAFYFIAEKKLDFRNVHKEIAKKLGCRVAIKQIGVRDYARLLGGIGSCGRELCCRIFLKDIKSITLRNARMQNLYINPDKISGACGKLKCCLLYEEELYKELRETSPKIGESVKIGDIQAEVIGIDIFSKQALLKSKNGEEFYVTFDEIERKEGK